MITKFHIFEKSIYRALDVESEYCPVCGSKGKKEGVNRTKRNMTVTYKYKCPACDFQWFEIFMRDYIGDELDNSFTYMGKFDINDKRIKKGSVIPKEQYNRMKLQTKKYNL